MINGEYMTPLHIKIMLHYYTSDTPYAEHDPAHKYSPAVKEYTAQLIMADMLTIPNMSVEQCHVTAKGRAYVEALTAVKEPVARTIWEQP